MDRSSSGDEVRDILLSARDVETGYGDLQVLYGVDIDVRNDEIVLIFGPNGAGKSTFMKALYKLLPLWEGRITIEGNDISDVPAERMVSHGISYVPQVNNVFPNMTVSENLDMGGVHSSKPEDRKQEIYDLFPRLGERSRQSADTLSGGERQMLAMGRALMPNPRILLIDEPSAGLAPQLVERTFDYIQRIRDQGTAVLMIEQNVKAGLKIADRGYVLDMGENKLEGTAEELLESEEVQELYLGK